MESESEAYDRDAELDLEASYDEPGPVHIDDPWLYTFKVGDNVWLRTSEGRWYPGQIWSKNVRHCRTRQVQGIYYDVIFFKHVRKFIAPLDGELKPDTSRTRTLLRKAGWL
ncbi:hypothetical protein BC834DRAFT_818312 [Gloeopeniophorella convolvens]|nr:hypothetical protein BC834DRAFT_818312 [Gloeopeniophorella convolvens]